MFASGEQRYSESVLYYQCMKEIRQVVGIERENTDVARQRYFKAKVETYCL